MDTQHEQTHSEEKPKMHRLKLLRWILALAIVVILNLFFAVAIHIVYKEPSYDHFCVNNRITQAIETKEACEATSVGGQWNPNTQPKPMKLAAGEIYPAGYCDTNYTCNKNFQGAQSLYNRNVFVVLVVLGLLSLIVGYLLAMSSAVSLGLSLGGLVSLIIATVRYWSDMHEYLRLVILALALVALIYFGIKKFRD